MVEEVHNEHFEIRLTYVCEYVCCRRDLDLTTRSGKRVSSYDCRKRPGLGDFDVDVTKSFEFVARNYPSKNGVRSLVRSSRLGVWEVYGMR